MGGAWYNELMDDGDFEQKFQQDVKVQAASEAAKMPASTPKNKALIWSIGVCVLFFGIIVALTVALVYQINRANELEEELEWGPSYEEELDPDIYDEEVYDENFEADVPNDDTVLDFEDGGNGDGTIYKYEEDDIEDEE